MLGNTQKMVAMCQAMLSHGPCTPRVKPPGRKWLVKSTMWANRVGSKPSLSSGLGTFWKGVGEVAAPVVQKVQQ